MENQKIIKLLNKIDTDSKHFATKKWYIINDENNSNYGVNKDTGAVYFPTLHISDFEICSHISQIIQILLNTILEY